MLQGESPAEHLSLHSGSGGWPFACRLGLPAGKTGSRFRERFGCWDRQISPTTGNKRISDYDLTNFAKANLWFLTCGF